MIDRNASDPSCLLFSCYHRDVLTTVTEDYGVDLLKCQVISVSQPDISPDLSCPATDVSNQSFLIISSSQHPSVVLTPVAVSMLL